MRICSHCQKEMSEGYCIEGGLDYYCSDDCLEQHMSRDEFNELYDNEEGDSYWTEWEDEEEMEYDESAEGGEAACLSLF